MKKKILLTALLTMLLLLGNFLYVAVVSAAQPPVDETTFYVGTIGMPDVLDPVDCYDTASGEIIMNIYDTLIDFKVDYSKPPKEQGLTAEFAPGLATEWSREDVVMILHNETAVNQMDPTCSYWTNGTHLFHINNWVDNKPDGTLGPCDVVYIEAVTTITDPYDPWAWIPCTKYTYHVKEKWHEGSTVFLTITRRIYYFKIRQGVKIHDWEDFDGNMHIGEELTCEDVVYSLRRNLVQDPLYGPNWMYFKPLFDQMNQDYWRDKGLPGLIELGKLINCAIQGNYTHVRISMGIDFPETAWYQILSSSWASIVPKDFAIDHFCWPGIKFNATNYPVYEYYWRWPDPFYGPLSIEPTQLSPTDPTPLPHPHPDPAPTARGTGPYSFTYWDTVTEEWRIDKFANYWGGWDASGADDRAAHIPYHVDTVIETNVPEWSTRKMMFLEGDFDQIAVPRAFMWDLLEPTPPYDALPGIICEKDLPTVSSSSLHYIFNISLGSPYMPSIEGADEPLFFSNDHVRKAFSWSMDFDVFLSDAWFGEAIQTPTWHITGLSPDYKDTSVLGYNINLTKVETELKAATFGSPPKSLWNSGFNIKLCYNEGNDQRRIASELIETAIESLNAKRGGLPPFVIEVMELPWPDFLLAYKRQWLPLLIIGWLSDFLDADNWARPYMHTYGDYAHLQGYSNATVDLIIDLAVKTPDGPERRDMYYELQRTFISDNPSLMLVQALGRSWRRIWIQGWLYNQLAAGTQFYERWKGFKEDFNRDLKVNLLDLVQLATKFGTTVPPTDPKYDLDGNGKINLLDLVKCAKNFGAGI